MGTDSEILVPFPCEPFQLTLVTIHLLSKGIYFVLEVSHTSLSTYLG